MRELSFFATCPKNLEDLLAQELESLGVSKTKQTIAGVMFNGELESAYRVCLWSRLANRILLPLGKITAKTATELYQGVMTINWLEHLLPTDTFVVDFSGTSDEINNSHFGALRVKDAICDYIRGKTGQRPSINKDNPGLRINVYLHHAIATISIDLSGDSLHRRGYRQAGGMAPLKENLAAAILYRANWPKRAKQGTTLIDPMCGSGTIIAEAALMACDIAPGLLHKKFGFTRWQKHDAKIWNALLKEAEMRKLRGLQNLKIAIYGYDKDPEIINIAKQNIENAGLNNVVKIEQREITVDGIIRNDNSSLLQLNDIPTSPGIIITNPPYGERLGDKISLTRLYKNFGTMLTKNFSGWDLAALTSNPDLAIYIPTPIYKQYNFFNGAIPCKLLLSKL